MFCQETRITEWEANTSLNVSTWTELWCLPTDFHDGWFFQSVWLLNSNKVLFQFEQNGEVVIEADLDDYVRLFSLTHDKHSFLIQFPLVEYENMSWQFCLQNPARASVPVGQKGFRILMKASDDGPTKKVVRGLTVWGPQ